MRRFSLLVVTLASGICYAQPPTILGVVNGASFTKGAAVSPGSLVSIFGTGLVSKLASADTIPLSTTLSGVTVTFADLPPAPLLAVIPGAAGQDQINVQLPWEIGTGSGVVNIVVNTPNGASAPSALNFAQSVPGIFTAGLSGKLYAVAVNYPDNTLAWPQGLVPGSHPATAGGTLVIYATGLGAVDHTPVDGGIPTQLATTVVNPTVLIGGVPAKVLFSGLSPQFVGVNQLNVQVPDGVTPGSAVPLQIQVNGFTSTNQAVIAIQ